MLITVESIEEFCAIATAMGFVKQEVTKPAAAAAAKPAAAAAAAAKPAAAAAAAKKATAAAAAKKATPAAAAKKATPEEIAALADKITAKPGAKTAPAEKAEVVWTYDEVRAYAQTKLANTDLGKVKDILNSLGDFAGLKDVPEDLYPQFILGIDEVAANA